MIPFGHSLSSLLVSGASAILGLIFVLWLSRRVLSSSPGNDRMIQISNSIHAGAMTFLTREYRIVAPFVLILAILISLGVSRSTAFAFVVGAACSLLAGFIGMKIATRANSRTTQAASQSVNAALGVAFQGGAVMGISVVSLGLLGLVVVFSVFLFRDGQGIGSFPVAARLMAGFSMGASLVALFARVGGGIYTKAADVGADLVGKIEAGIPEDDPRNPAVIADNVGDNVGDVAGMGADLFESYVGAIIATMVLAVSSNTVVDGQALLLAFLLASWGLISSMFGVFFVRTTEKSDPQAALSRGMWSSAILFGIGSFLLCRFWYGNIAFFWAILSGLLAGLIIGFTAEYYTSGKRVERLAESAKTGPATCIISGTALAMESTVVPLVAISLAIVIAYFFAGIIGVALSAIGMLALTGMTVAVDAYGPIADNAAGIAEMAQLGGEVRRRAEKLDAVGNTTAAVGKGFAIGSAALTALALFTAYSQTMGLSGIDVLKSRVVAGMFVGGVVPFIFCAMTMKAVGRTAFKVVEEVRRQFREIAGLMEGKVLPDSAACVDIATKGALREMVIPGLMAIFLPLIIGLLMGGEALGGFLVGSLISGVPLAIFLANAGGAWDNAKKFVEEGNLGGKGSPVHKATVIGDTVGDPFKDTSGPSLNILLKLMSVVSLVFAGVISKYHLF